MPVANKKTQKAAFTLIELLVVITIISLLITMLLPVLDQSRVAARLMICQATLRSIGQASASYSTDCNQWTVHGVDDSAYLPAYVATGYGYSFYNTQIFMDDWGIDKPNGPTPVYNIITGGAHNPCGVGQLMWDYRIAEQIQSIACPQSDYREPTNFLPGGSASNYTYTLVKQHMAAWFTTNFDPVTPTSNEYWRCEFYTGGYSYCYWASSYVVRGPLMRQESANPKFGLFCDQEGAGQSIIPNVPAGRSPVPYGWGRIHKEGFNVLYVDGTVALFRDPDRTITYANYNAQDYGNGWCLQPWGTTYGTYDRK